MELYYQESGSGPSALIILHGLFGASGNWRTLSRNTFGTAYRTLAVDLRNHGRSPHADEMNYEAMAADVVELMDRLDIRRAHVLGHSMGGKVAMELALSHADRVDHLVVADIAPKTYPPAHDTILEALSSVDPSAHEDRDAIDAALGEWISDAAIRQFLMKNLERDGSAYRWKMNLPVIRAAYDHLRGGSASFQPFDGPTLFIAGGRSSYIAREDLPAIHRLFPHAELEVLPEAGHWLHAEEPEAFGDLVLAFLET